MLVNRHKVTKFFICFLICIIHPYYINFYGFIFGAISLMLQRYNDFYPHMTYPNCRVNLDFFFLITWTFVSLSVILVLSYLVVLLCVHCIMCTSTSRVSTSPLSVFLYIYFLTHFIKVKSVFDLQTCRLFKLFSFCTSF